MLSIRAVVLASKSGLGSIPETHPIVFVQQLWQEGIGTTKMDEICSFTQRIGDNDFFGHQQLIHHENVASESRLTVAKFRICRVILEVCLSTPLNFNSSWETLHLLASGISSYLWNYSL